MNRVSEITKALNKNKSPYNPHQEYIEPSQVQQLTVVCDENSCRIVEVEEVDSGVDRGIDRDRDRDIDFVEQSLTQRRGFGGRRQNTSTFGGVGGGGCSSCGK